MSKKLLKNLVPKIRFPEFQNTRKWEEKTLECMGKFTGGGTPSKMNDSYWNGKIPWISSSDISNDSIHQIKISRFITKEAIRESATKLVPENSILLVSRVGVGKLAITKNQLCTSQDFTNFTPEQDDLIFLAYYLKSYKDKLLAYSQGMAIKGFTKEDVSKLKLFVPDSKEQQKIADCLSSLDDLITTHIQKHKALKAQKKGLMQQLFPAEGETTPKLRFPEFRGAGKWKIKQFDKLFTIGNGKDHKHLSNGDIPVYGSGGYMRSVNEYLYEGESPCIGRKGTINSPMFLTGKFWTVDTLFYTHSFKGCLPKFIYLIFQNVNWLSHNEAGGVPSLSKKNIGKIGVAVPKSEEQKKIVGFISSLDNLIVAQCQKIESLKAHKKGLMQQLFPATDEVNG